MCGISGFSVKNFNENQKEFLIENFKKLQVHRGPDFNDEWNDDKNYFFHHRLALIDESANGNQPFYNEDYVLCYNGEIYNFLQLKQSLPHIDFVSKSDTEVLFYYLIHFGIEKTLQDIKGMFAFSFYSKKKREIILARDRYGIKPLYFVNNQTIFAFASEVRTLAKALQLKPDSYKTIMSLNSTAEGSTTYTLFNDIENIDPGTYIKISENFTVTKHQYYRLSDDVDEKIFNELSRKSKNQILSDFEDLVSNSVKEMLVSDSPMGSFVSGGIDSSIITAIAKKFSPNLSLFTADIIGKHSEYEDAKLLATYLNLNLKKVDFDQSDFLKYWIQATEHNAAPIVYFTNALPISRVANLARENNIKAILSGEGSDEIFLGYSKLMAQRYKSKLLLPEKIVKSIYKLYPALNNYLFPSEYSNLDSFNIRLANGFKSEMLYADGKELFSHTPKSQQKYYIDSYEMMQKHLHALLYRNDRMGMISSIEVRFPFLHEDVIKFAINLPLEYKTRWTTKLHNKKHPFITDKWIVREISKKYLPADLVSKKKNGLPIDGLNNLKFKKDFFKNGYIAENLKLDDTALNYLIENENPYFIGKLASVELFGMNYHYDVSNEEMQTKINSFCSYK
jgi:asparagine synthase (glutamine-hydrolysing)